MKEISQSACIKGKDFVSRSSAAVAFARDLTGWSVLIICGAATAIGAETSQKELLAQFIQSPPPIREMVVEGIWYSRGETNTEWMTLCWQRNGYVFRTSKKRMSLFEVFDKTCDDVISMRSNDTYSVVSDYKVLGVHVRQVEGLQPSSGTNGLDIVTPMVVEHHTRVSIALSAGLPMIPPGAALQTNDTFYYRDESHRSVITAVMTTGDSHKVDSIAWTNTIDANGTNAALTIHGPISLFYRAGTSSPAWFPSEIVRELEVLGVRRTIGRLLVHRLDLGEVPVSEFYPGRFLPSAPAGSIVTSNGVSTITLRKPQNRVETKSVANPRQIGETPPSNAASRRFTAKLVVIIVFILGPLGMLAALMLRRRR